MTTLTLKDPTLLKDRCYVAGEWIGGAATIPVTNPVDDSVVGRVPKLGARRPGARSRPPRRRRRAGPKPPPRSARRLYASGSA